MAGDDKPADAGDGKVEATPEREGSAGRNRFRNRRGNRQNAAAGTTVVTKQSTFVGRVEALKGHVYDCSDHKQAELFVKTTREISG